MKRYLLTFFILITMFSRATAQCTVMVSAMSSASCGICNGAVELTFTGGTPPYFINFNGTNYGSPGGAPVLISGLCPGGYGFSVTDAGANLCTGSVNITISSYGSPLYTTVSTTNPTCPTCNDGSVTVSTTGGIPPFMYLWSNGSTSSSINNLSAGIYVLYTSDSIGCTDIDTVVLSYNGANLYTVSGKVFYDTDQDSVYTSNDIPLVQQQVQILPSGFITYTNANGEYIYGDTANASINVSYVANNNYSVSNGIPSYSVVLTAASAPGLDFAVLPDSLYHSISVYTYSAFPRCLTNVPVYTAVTNNGTYMDSGSVTLNFDPNMFYTGSNPPGQLNGQSVTFNFSQLLPFETRIFTSYYNFPAAGTTLYTTSAAALTNASGTTLAVDSSADAFAVRCSWDPNDKQVTPPGVGATNRVDMDTELRYMIRFQNTGTDTAFNVIVTDTIDAGIDLNSLYVIATSHPCLIQKVNGNVMKFVFENIMLPDSNVNEPESHGYILFRALGNNNNPDPTEVYNTANIYFDLNPAVITNTTFTTFSNNTVGVQSVTTSRGTIKLSPHPLQSSTIISFDGPAGHTYTLQISDLSGRNVRPAKVFTGPVCTLQKDNMPAGIYFIQITDNISKEIYNSKLLVK